MADTGLPVKVMNNKQSMGTKKTFDRWMAGLRNTRGGTIAGITFLLLIFAIVSVFVRRTSQSDAMLILNGQPTPVRAFAGAFSSVANLCLILMVVFYGKPGFIAAIVILVIQFPGLMINIFGRHNYSSITGLFTNVFAIIATVLIYMNNERSKKYQEKIHTQAVTDALTGLPNRFACTELMDMLIRQKTRFALVTFNLNNFKSINSTMGVKTGNDVLVEIGSRLSRAAEKSLSGTRDIVTCQGGDEFSLIVCDYKTEQQLLDTINSYKKVIEETITLDGCDYFLTASVGYVEYPGDAVDSNSLLSAANIAMQSAKHNLASERVCHYTKELSGHERSLEIERKIRLALQNDTLFFHLQPQYDVSHKLIGFEALARMRDEEGRFVSPADFIPVAESAGLIDEVDLRVFRKSADFFGQLLRKSHSDITLSVNASVKHLMKNDFLDEVREVLRTSGVPANQLEIEITESIMIDSVEKALQCILELKKMGIRIAIDDFGTGYSSLSYLNNFPADKLKIDKSFIDKINLSDSSKKYIAAIVTIGHVMNFKVISEGVEEDDQLETLRNIGCDYIQGYIWGRPMSAEDAEQLTLRQAG
ncbi:MAG: EAL domain-containing protein [Clostridia bacterium]|nr:EAL domain-containing protein [Clostridia bacterium]